MALNIGLVLDSKCAVQCQTKTEARFFFDEVVSVFPELSNTAEIKLSVYESLGSLTTYVFQRGHGGSISVLHCDPDWWIDKGYTVLSVFDVLYDLDLGEFSVDNTDIEALLQF